VANPARRVADLICVVISAPAQELLACWCARLALPVTADSYEPRRLRRHILAVPGRIVHAARRRQLRTDTNWPWAEIITTTRASRSARCPMTTTPPPKDQEPRSSSRPQGRKSPLPT
jgi:hypothetical protein